MIYGASGHGKVVADIAAKVFGNGHVRGFLDDRPELAGREVGGFEVLGRGEDALKDWPAGVELVLAIGSNRTRQKLATAARKAGCGFATLVHPSAQVGRDVVIGPGSVVMANAVINSGARVGDHVIVNTGATVDHDCIVEDFAHISPGVNLAGSVWVGQGAHVGIGACAIPCVRIGAWSVVGAGATVISDIPEGVIVVGTPAAPIPKGG
ncbi:MAG: acetyltransferase [Chloroflexi bacterium]|nr:acetyltransferase [Chloroflexota bacterium]